MSGAPVRPDADATADAAEAAGAATASPTAALRDLALGRSTVATVGATTALGGEPAATADAATAAASASSSMLAPQQLGRMLRTRTDRIYLRSWR